MKKKLPKKIEIGDILCVFAESDLYDYLLEELASHIKADKAEVKYLSQTLKKSQRKIWVNEYKKKLTMFEKQLQYHTNVMVDLKEAALYVKKAYQLWLPKKPVPKKKSLKKSSKTG